jgi:hypothetical protein
MMDEQMDPRASMEVPEDMQEPLERIVLAGKKVMFSEETADMVQEALAGDAPIEDKLSEAIAGLMGLLWQQSNQTMPPQLIVPASMILLSEAVDFLQGAGEEITPAQYGDAIELTISRVLEMFGIDEQMLDQELSPERQKQAPEGIIQGAMS